MSTPFSPRATSSVAVLAVTAATAYAGLAAWAASRTAYATWSAFVFIPVLVLFTMPMLVRAGRRDPDPRFLRLLAWAFALKMVATTLRYLMAFVFYHGVADASGYDGNGARLATAWRLGESAPVGRGLVGTGFMRVLTGLLYTITGQSVFVAYAVFSWLGFWGLYFLYRAFRVAVPDGDSRRYALLVFLLPSMLFWDSSLGKEAWMTLGLGVAAYGAALMCAGDRRWPVPLVLGLVATGLVRPNITAALVAAIAVAYLMRKSLRPSTELTPLVRALGLMVVLVGVYFAAHQAASFVGATSIDSSNVDAAFSTAGAHTNEGGSSFQATVVRSPVDFPRAAVTVLFRPFPTEASNVQMLIAAAEGTLLLGLFALSWRRLSTVPGRLRSQPYLIMCLAYAAIFVYGFSYFANFGILTRERVQVLPFVLVFLALPHPPLHSKETAQPRPMRATT
jgi:hypothetical protein